MSTARLALSRNLPCGLKLNSIKRDLFGPSNPSETNRIFNEEIEKHNEIACKTWGFDFRAGLPLQCNASFVWERLDPPQLTHTPEMYTLTRAAHVRPSVSHSSSLDLLMDERAERENFMSNASDSSAADTDSCDDSQDELMPAACTSGVSGLGYMKSINYGFGQRTAIKRRQPKITEYMKERKRLAQAPKKMSSSPPAKRMRTTSGSSTTSSAHILGTSSSSGSGSSILMHFRMQRRNLQQ